MIIIAAERSLLEGVPDRVIDDVRDVSVGDGVVRLPTDPIDGDQAGGPQRLGEQPPRQGGPAQHGRRGGSCRAARAASARAAAAPSSEPGTSR